jgi:transcriptional regulator with XRE-family HTH domain
MAGGPWMNKSEAKINRAIGQRLRDARIRRELSLMKLADKTDVTYQAIFAYETGRNVIPAAKLVTLGKILGLPIGYFFGIEKDRFVKPPGLMRRWQRRQDG